MTQQDASNRTTVDSGALKLALNVLRRAGKNEVADALEETAIRGQSALAEQDDEAVAWAFESATEITEGLPLGDSYGGFKRSLSYKKPREHPQFRNAYPLYRRPAPKTYTESDIDEAIGVVEWDKLNLFATAEMVKQIVMRFVGSQVTMEVKRLSEDEVRDRIHYYFGRIDNADDFVELINDVMNIMTGGGE